MIKNSVLFLDMDGVIADFVGGASKKFDRQNPYLDPTIRGSDWYWKVEKLLGFECPADFWNHLDYNFWRNLPKYPDADAVIEVCRLHFSTIVFLTSPCHTLGCCDGKIDWAKEHYADIPLILTRSVKGSPPPKNAVAGSNKFLIDDWDDNVDAFEKFGGTAFLVPRPWNKIGHKVKEVYQSYTESLVQAIDMFRRGF